MERETGTGMLGEEDRSEMGHARAATGREPIEWLHHAQRGSHQPSQARVRGFPLPPQFVPAENVLQQKKGMLVVLCVPVWKREGDNLWPSTFVQLCLAVVVLEQPSSPVLEDEDDHEEDEDVKIIVVSLI